MSTTSNKRQLASGISVIAIAASLGFATPAHAQTTSTIQGHAPAGSTITATDLNTGRADTAKADASGSYVLPGVPPSTYRVQSGSASQTVVVPLGQAVTVDLVGPAASTGGSIVVVGARTRDVKTPTVATNVSRFQIENLPNGDRNFLNFAALAPGVTVSPPTLGGTARQVQAGAIASDFTNTFIDGISIKNLVNHGGTVGQNISSGNPFPASAVDQFDVQTQNFKAEFEQAGSAVISTVTKTGGNRFHGEIFGEWAPKSFISENYDDRPGHRLNRNSAHVKPNFHTKYYGGDIGGPIIPEKLTFFVDYEATDKIFGSKDIIVFPNNLAGISSGAQSYIQTARTQFNGSFPATFKEQLYFGKLTWFATPADTVHVSGFIRHESNLQLDGGIITSQASKLSHNTEHRYQLSWNHRASNWLNEFTIARDAAENGQVPTVPGSQYIVTFQGVTVGPTPAGCITVNGSSPNAYTCPNTGNSQQAILGATDFAQDDHQYQTLIKDNVTITDGPHTIKFGGKINFTKLQRLEANKSNGTYYFDAANFTGAASSTPYAAQINIAAVQPVTAKNTEVGFFAQDDWRPDDHWQVSAGLRWDYESNARNENFVTPAGLAAALRAYPGWAAAGINPDDYISTGHNRKHFYGAFQPRLGVSYDVNGDRELVFTLGAGRYYDRSLFIDSALETVKDYYETITTIRTCAIAPTDPLCVTTLPSDPNALRVLGTQRGSGEAYLLNNNTKVPYSDELTAGVRKRFGKINTSLAVSYIKSHNIFQYVIGNRLPDGSYSGAINPVIVYNGIPFGTGVFFGGGADGLAPLPGFGRIVIGNSAGKATYAALYLTADKPYTEESGWGFSSALTISTARSNDGAATGFIGGPFWFDTPNVGDQGWQPVAGMERWRFVGTGTVKIPWDIKLSTVVTLSSGPSFGSGLGGVPQSVAGPGGPGGYFTDFGILRPKGFINYKNIDFNVSKSFKLPWNRGQELTVYFQALNAFDFVNRNYSMWSGGFQNYGGPGPSRQPDFTGVASQGRNFKVGAKFTF